jgi:hypothetical protein
MKSKFLTEREIAGILNLGDVFIPGEGELPPFSKSNGIGEVDRVMAYVPPQDLKDLKMLLGILGLMPAFVSRLLIWVTEKGRDLPSPVGDVLRLIRIGLRGVVFSLYYAQSSVSKSLGYNVQVERSEKRVAETPVRPNRVHDLSA